VIIEGAPLSSRVEIFQTETNRIDPTVALGTLGFFQM